MPIPGIVASARTASAPVLPVTAGLLHWHDPSYAPSVTFGVSPKISAVSDLGPNNWQFFNTYAPEQPNLVLGGLKAGLNAIEYPDWNYVLNGLTSSGANQKPLTCFAVVKHTGVARDRVILGTNNTNGFLWEIRPDHRQLVNQHLTANIGNSTSVVPTNTTAILCVTYSATGVLSFYLNNVADGVVTNDRAFTASPSQARLGMGSGGAQGYVGQIGEVIKYNTVLSAGDRTTVYNYLAAKWVTAPAFTPPSLPNCVLWLDGDDDASFTYSSGAEVSQWNDKSGGARHVTQSTVGKQPTRSTAALNGRDIVIFNRTNGDCLTKFATSITGTTATVFIVAYLDSTDVGNERVFSINGTFDEDYQGSGGVFVYATASNYPMSYRDGYLSQAPTMMHSQWLTIASIFDGTNHTMYTGSTAHTPVACTLAFNAVDINLASSKGGGECANVRIAEVIMYSDAKNSTDRATIRNYLTTKWGL